MTEEGSNNPFPEDSNGENGFYGPTATVEEVLACQFSSWYPAFSKVIPLSTDYENRAGGETSTKRKNVTIPSVIIEDLPSPDFQNYLLSDGVKLPKDATKLSSCAGASDAIDDENDENSDHDDSVIYHFPELNARIEETIKDKFSSADGVLPKLNWSAPRDATWINEGTMRCKTAGDVYLLLKSSDFCTHDVLYESLKECSDYHSNNNNNNNNNNNDHSNPPLQLVLRKWCNLNPSMEFRCFVRDHELVGISQRQHSVHFPHLHEDRDRLFDLIHDFFEDYVDRRFASGRIANYVWDVFVDKKDRAWVVDFNPWSRVTDALLYEWSELVSVDLDDVRESDAESGMRIATSEREVKHDPLASYRAPIDTVDLASMTHGDAKQFEEFMKLCQRPTYWEENSSGSDDDDEKEEE